MPVDKFQTLPVPSTHVRDRFADLRIVALASDSHKLRIRN
jgi:hypothetical protein